MNGTIGDLLREWRSVHGMSQLDLALAAGVSSRHVSFVETGRARPSRKMVLRLVETLDLPLRERNAALLAAGFAPYYKESGLEEADLAPVRGALELVLASHEPYPAFVLDGSWNILMGNRAHLALLQTLLPPGTEPPDPVNVIRLVLDPALVRPRVLNWESVARVLGHRIRRQLRRPNLSEQRRALLENLLAYPGVAEAVRRPAPPPETALVIPLELEVGGRCLSWFSTIATLGTPQDVTLDELCIESLFPANEETARAARALARAGQPDTRDI